MVMVKESAGVRLEAKSQITITYSLRRNPRLCVIEEVQCAELEFTSAAGTELPVALVLTPTVK